MDRARRGATGPERRLTEFPMSQSAAPIAPSSPPNLGPRILVALTARERALFFSDREVHLPWQVLSDAELAPAAWDQRITQINPPILVTAWSTPALPVAWLASTDCALRYVCHVTGSVRRLVPRSFLERGGVVSNWGDTVSAQVAEHALLLALSALRSAPRWAGFIRRDPDDRHIEELGTKTLFGRRIGIHGFGSVARALVPLLRPFAVEIMAYSAGVPPEMMRPMGVSAARTLEELFEASEILFECEALNATSQRSVSATVLARLPDDSTFVNVGRGGVVDEEALVGAARSGRLRLALDVVVDEPLTARSPFFSHPSAVLSPHIAGPTRDQYWQCGAFALANLRSYLRGATPPAALTLAAYDRAT